MDRLPVRRSLRAPLRGALRDLPLLWKLLIPSLVMTIVLGSGGAFILVRYEHRGAQAALDQRVFARAVDAQVEFRDQTVALLDSLRVAANLQGVAEALDKGRRDQAAGLLVGVPAIRDDIDLLVATDVHGVGLVQLRRRDTEVANTVGDRWAQGILAGTISGTDDARRDKRAGIIDLAGNAELVVATPVRTDHVVGMIVVGRRLDRIVAATAQRLGVRLAVTGPDGRLAASSAPLGHRPVSSSTSARAQRVRVRGVAYEVLDSPLTLGGERAGTVSTAVATAPFFARVRGAERRVVLLVFLAMVGVVGLAVGLSRLVTRQMRPLIETNRALGRGDLGARAPVFGRDELGEVAAGLNVMAEQLQASYAELEMRVAARTEELQRVYDELEAVLRARTEVFAAVSHEFRSPLFAILGHADLMDDPAFKPQGRRWRVEFAHTIRQSAQMLLGRVNELLDIARVESTSVELFREDVRLADVVGDLRLTMAALARRAGLDLLLDIPESLPPVNADAARVREVVLNLVSNAVKYTPASGTVTVRASSVNGHVSVTVTDTGRGIPATATERIFEPFYRIDGAGSEGAEPSTGLGLAIVQRLVRAHGGDVTCRSEPGRGSTFTFTLPSADSVVSAPADAGRTAGVGGVSDAAGGAAIEADGEPANQQS